MVSFNFSLRKPNENPSWSLVLDADAGDVARWRDVLDGGVVHLQHEPPDLGVARDAEGHVRRQLQLEGGWCLNRRNILSKALARLTFAPPIDIFYP